MTLTVPTFSLATWRRAADPRPLSAALCRACHEVGFLYVVDHDVPADFLTDYFALLQRFFALPAEVKEQIAKTRSPHFRGWEQVGAELTNNRVDYREQLDLCTENPPYAADAHPAFLRLEGPNQWLADDVLPGFEAAVRRFFALAGDLAWELMEVMSEGLGLERGHIRSTFGEQPFSLMKLIHYPTTPPGEAGVNAHHDAGFLTVLFQHEVGGLQAQGPDGEWIDVDPPKGAIIINVGEMLQATTGNYFVASTHRVIAHQERYSSAYFHGPDLRTPLYRMDLPERFAEAVDASPRHRAAGFMAKRHELLDGRDGIESASAPVFGEQMWNYYVRSYPDVVEQYYADSM